MKIALFMLNYLLNLVNSGDGLAKSRNLWLLVYCDKCNGVRWFCAQQYLLTCIYSRSGPLCNEKFRCRQSYSIWLSIALWERGAWCTRGKAWEGLHTVKSDWRWLVEISQHDILLSLPSANLSFFFFLTHFTGNLKWEEWLYEWGSVYLWNTQFITCSGYRRFFYWI